MHCNKMDAEMLFSQVNKPNVKTIYLGPKTKHQQRQNPGRLEFLRLQRLLTSCMEHSGQNLNKGVIFLNKILLIYSL